MGLIPPDPGIAGTALWRTAETQCIDTLACAMAGALGNVRASGALAAMIAATLMLPKSDVNIFFIMSSFYQMSASGGADIG
jgi:hypothetical protein